MVESRFSTLKDTIITIGALYKHEFFYSYADYHLNFMDFKFLLGLGYPFSGWAPLFGSAGTLIFRPL
jgi:hypothetical protein